MAPAGGADGGMAVTGDCTGSATTGGGVEQGYEEAIAAAWDSLNETGVVGGISEGGAELADGDVYRVVKIAEALVGPDAGAEFFAGDQAPGALEQNLKDLEGLILELDAATRFTDLSGVEIGLKCSKFDRAVSVRHLGYSVIEKV